MSVGPDQAKLSELERERLLRQGVEGILQERELAPLLERVLGSACGLLGANDGAVGLLEQQPRQIRIASVFRLPESEIGTVWRPGQGLAGKVLAASGPVIINRYGDVDPHGRAEIAENAVIGVPIKRRNKLLGFFGLGASPPRKFDDVDIELLDGFARACGVAIENAMLFDESKRNLSEANDLLVASSGLNSAMNVDQVVSAYLSHIGPRYGHMVHVVLYELDADGVPQRNVVRGSWQPKLGVKLDVRSEKHTRDDIDPLLESGKPVWFSNVFTDPTAPEGLKREQERDGRAAIALVPLVSQGKRIGLVVLSSEQPHDWDSNEIRPILLSSTHLAAALDSRQQGEELLVEREKLALSEERKRLARDLHDSVTQLIFSLHMMCQSLAENPPAGPDPAPFNRLVEISRAASKEMRGLIAELRPIEGQIETVSRKGEEELGPRLQRHAAELGATFGLVVDEGPYSSLAPKLRHSLFRIAQEAITNAFKHAEPQCVTVRLMRQGQLLVMTVHDDGRGINETSKSGTFGIVSMRERAREHGGSLVVESSDNGGTVVTVKTMVEL